MIDIHCHILYGVDDGPKDMEESIEMLEDAVKQGIDTIILTPHYRNGMFSYPTEIIESHYKNLVSKFDDSLNLYLGCEYHVDEDIYKNLMNYRIHTLNDGSYILTEYKYSSPYQQILEYTQELIYRGYTPVIAHIERYKCFRGHIDAVERLSDIGALIQINADALLKIGPKKGLFVSKEVRDTYKFCHTLLKYELVDVVASDAHGISDRVNHMKQARDLVYRKYGKDYADMIFERIPRKIVEGK